MIHQFKLTIDLSHEGMSQADLESWKDEIIDLIQESAHCSQIGSLTQVSES